MTNGGKSRLTALDGLRGLAAFAVMLSHMGVNPLVIVDSPVFMFIYRMFSAGSNAVQVLFVLSGFLMAYLYPTIAHVFEFIKKRYARIIPIYAVVVLYIWWSNLDKKTEPIWQHVVALAVIAVGMALSWLAIEKLSQIKFGLGKVVFGLFVLFQIGFLLSTVTFLPKVMDGRLVTLTEFQKEGLVMLSNLSLTVPFAHNIIPMSGVFWSLVPEMLFYILYPFLVVPIIAVGNKWGWKVGAVMTLGVIKVIFDLDMASLSLFSLHTMFIGRATGFVVGILVGTLYRNKYGLWQKVEPFLKHPITSAVAIVAFFVLIGFEWGDAVYQVRHYLNVYYLVLSVSIGLLVATVIQQSSVASKVFSTKVLTFLGMVSYSLYLIHSEVIHVLKYPVEHVIARWQLPERVFVMLATTILCAISIVIAYGLFKVVESLYFRRKAKPVLEKTHKKVSTEKTQPVFVVSARKAIIGGILTSFFFIGVYAGTFAPSLVMAHHMLSFNFFDQPIISQNKAYTFEFSATQPNLSVVFVGLDYVRDPAVIDDRRVAP
jgi:peptidoglycan/LPS O-acetylase OafA/YrhL